MEYSCFVCVFVLEERRVCFGVRVLNEWLECGIFGKRLGLLLGESVMIAMESGLMVYFCECVYLDCGDRYLQE
jgi:hypothetical protein